MLKYTDVDVNSLSLASQTYFRRYSYVEHHSNSFWYNLEYSLPRNKKGHSYDLTFDAYPINDATDQNGEDDNAPNVM